MRKMRQGPGKEVDTSFPQILLRAEAHKVLLGWHRYVAPVSRQRKWRKGFSESLHNLFSS